MLNVDRHLNVDGLCENTQIGIGKQGALRL